jgi:hypothetical protein
MPAQYSWAPPSQGYTFNNQQERKHLEKVTMLLVTYNGYICIDYLQAFSSPDSLNKRVQQLFARHLHCILLEVI